LNSLFKAEAYSPSHITGFFAIFKNGSTGAGLNLEEGVKTKVVIKESRSDKIIVKLNGKKFPLKTTERVIKKFLSKTRKKFFVTAEHNTKMPFGYGLGLSGASALSVSLALNKALSLKLSKKTCIQIAHDSEVEEKTGLGDVFAEKYSGFLLGKKPYPSHTAEKISLKEKYVVLAFFNPIETKKVITSPEKKKLITKFGLKCMKLFEKEKTIKNFIFLCNYFSTETQLITPRLKKLIHVFPNSSMAMLGETLFVATNNPIKIKKQLSKYCKNVQCSKIAKKGACLI